MLRNDLITKLAAFDNDPVTVDVDGVLIDVESVTTDRGSVVLLLDLQELQAVLDKRAGKPTAPDDDTPAG